MNMKEIQKEIWDNKVNKGFNIADVNKNDFKRENFE